MWCWLKTKRLNHSIVRLNHETWLEKEIVQTMFMEYDSTKYLVWKIQSKNIWEEK